MMTAAALWGAFTSGLGRFVTFVGNSRPAQIALLSIALAIGYKRAIAKAERQGEATGTEKTLDKIESETRETLQKMEDAENRVTADLDANSLRKLAERDPLNAGRPKRD